MTYIFDLRELINIELKHLGSTMSFIEKVLFSLITIKKAKKFLYNFVRYALIHLTVSFILQFRYSIVAYFLVLEV